MMRALNSNRNTSRRFDYPRSGDAGRGQLMVQRVALDAMFPRADFEALDGEQNDPQGPGVFLIGSIEKTSPHIKLLRKPAFQRETNHWTPEQVASFITSFVDYEVIPGLILWNSPCYMFIVDGGHRLSALRAWVEDDYGDGPISQHYYKDKITNEQKRIATRTRKLVEKAVGRFSLMKELSGNPVTGTGFTPEEARQQLRANRLFKREVQNQWIAGSIEIAESSFYKINTQGTALDETEELLIRNRRKALAIAARAILRAGSGHKYWSAFSTQRQFEVETLASEFYQMVFQPEIDEPVKTLDLPLGGTASPVDAQALLIEFLAITGNRDQKPREERDKVKSVNDYQADPDGQETIAVLRYSLSIVKRITGNDPGSLGLHPAVYFYSERGKFSRFMFLGMSLLLTERVRSNDSSFFKKFTEHRAKLEEFLISNRSVIGILLQQLDKNKRIFKMRDLLEFVLTEIQDDKVPPTEAVLQALGLRGRFYDVVSAQINSTEFSDDAKSMTFIKAALEKSLTCTECGGKIDPMKAMTYDHKKRIREGGTGEPENCQLMHPYCNTGKKN